MNTQDIDYDNLKKRGFLRQKQEGLFVLRTRMSGGVYTKELLEKLAQIAQIYGREIVHATVRQGLEIPYIRFEDIPKVEEELKSTKIEAGTSGPRLRTTTTCPGNNWCKSGLIDTFSLSKRIEDELGLRCGLDLPHKFKISISGCPNTCTRPQQSEIGIHGVVDTGSSQKRIGYAVYLGGCGGKNPRTGFKLEKVFSEDEILVLIAKTLKFYKEKAKPRQRLALLIEEIGKGTFLEELGHNKERVEDVQ